MPILIGAGMALGGVVDLMHLRHIAWLEATLEDCFDGSLRIPFPYSPPFDLD